MATPELHLKAEDEEALVTLPPRRSPTVRRGSTALRLLEAERVEDVAPILLQEIVGLGYPRAWVANVDFETGEFYVTESLNCSKSYLDRFRSSIYASGNPIIDAIHTQKPTVVADSSLHHRSLYVHPMLFTNRVMCWEAARVRNHECLAVDNSHSTRRLTLENQFCGTCGMRGYAIVAGVELLRPDTDVTKLSQVVDLANRYLVRLFKNEHYYGRMSEMDTTITQMETVMQSMSDPVVLTDTHHRVVMQNRAAERFFRQADNASEGLRRAVEMNNLLFTAALSSMAVSGGETSRDLTLVDALEGEEMLFEAVCTPTITREGKNIGMVTVMRDVTDLRRADNELRLNYERLSAAEETVRLDRDRLNLIVENVGDPIVVADNSAKAVLFDPMAQELFGVAGQAADAIRVRNQAQLDAYVTAFTFSFSDRNTGQVKLTNPKDGTESEYDARSGKIYDERGQVAFTVTVLRDFTAWRRLEQLKNERRMLQMEKFAAAGRLAATIAHEVNNPMESIKNAIYILSDFVNAEGQQMFGILQSETDRVARIVRQMLGLYRNNEQVKPINLNALLEDTLVLLDRQFQRVNVKVVTDLRSIPDAILAGDQLRQVFSNLLINAKDSMAAEGGVLQVRTRVVRSQDGLGGRFIRVTIADTGCGIPREMQQAIFDPFVTTKGDKGTGLGLWISKGIVSDHAGKIHVRSKPGKGTVFTLLFPVER